MDETNEWDSVGRAVLAELDDVIDRRLQEFHASLDAWLNGILAGHIPTDWSEQLAGFVERTAERGLAIAPHSIDALVVIIRNHRAATGRPGVDDSGRRVHSRFTADGAFVQSVIPTASGPPAQAARPSTQNVHRHQIRLFEFTAETQAIIRLLGIDWKRVTAKAMSRVRAAGGLIDVHTGAAIGQDSNSLGVETFVRLVRIDGRIDTARFRFVSDHWQFAEINRGSAPQTEAAALEAREKIRHADVMRVRGAINRAQGGMFAIVGGIGGIVEGAPLLGTIEAAGGAEQVVLAGGDLAGGEPQRAWSTRGIQAIFEAAGVDEATAEFLAENGGLLIALGRATVDASGNAFARVETSTGYRIRLKFDPSTLSANGLGGAKIKIERTGSAGQLKNAGKAAVSNTATSPTGLEVGFDQAGHPVDRQYTVGQKGIRGAGHKKVGVPSGHHRGHVKAVNEGAGVNPIDDGPPNIVAQTATVNLSNVKRFENWRFANAQGQKVFVSKMPNGYLRWRIPGKGYRRDFQSSIEYPFSE